MQKEPVFANGQLGSCLTHPNTCLHVPGVSPECARCVAVHVGQVAPAAEQMLYMSLNLPAMSFIVPDTQQSVPSPG